MNPAAKENIDELFPLAALPAFGFVFASAGLPENRVWGPDFENQAFIGASTWLSSTSLWGCAYRCDGGASVSPVQRFYASSYGRFNTADQYMASAGPGDPGTWNRYAYVRGDPINRVDPTGRDDELVCSGADSIASNDASCGLGYLGLNQNITCAQLNQLPGSAAWQNPSAMNPDPACYTVTITETTATPAAPPCYDNETNILDTLDQIAGDIVASAAQIKSFSSADLTALNNVLQGAALSEFSNIDSYIVANGGAPTTPSSFYNGGHFNLDVSQSALTSALGSTEYTAFQNLFEPAGLFAFINGGRRQTSARFQGGYTLHSELGTGSTDQFHLDSYNSWNPGHFIVDVVVGHLGTCLDPAWNGHP